MSIVLTFHSIIIITHYQLCERLNIVIGTVWSFLGENCAREYRPDILLPYYNVTLTFK